MHARGSAGAPLGGAARFGEEAGGIGLRSGEILDHPVQHGLQLAQAVHRLLHERKHKRNGLSITDSMLYAFADECEPGWRWHEREVKLVYLSAHGGHERDHLLQEVMESLEHTKQAHGQINLQCRCRCRGRKEEPWGEIGRILGSPPRPPGRRRAGRTCRRRRAPSSSRPTALHARARHVPS